MNHFSLRFNTYYRLGLFEYILLFIVLFVAFYLGMSCYALENINEGLYAEIPREMLQLGDYIIPHLNFVPYIEKPPLFYWLIALSYTLFGVSEWSARLIPASSASLLCLSLVFFGNAIRRNREGWLAALILATSVGFIGIGRVLIFDMLLTLLFSLSLLSFYIWYHKSSVLFLRLFYVFLGLAFLTKGMVALFLIPIIILLFMFKAGTRWRKMALCVDIPGIILFLAIAIPWHWLAMKQQPGFIWDYFINEQVYRFLDKRIPHDYHTGPFYFYLPKLIFYLFPWSLLALLLFKPSKSIDKSLYNFLWIWFVVTLVFFSLSRAKGDYYMIIGTPPLALLLSLKINDLFNSKNKTTLFYFFVILAFLEAIIFGLLYLATSESSSSLYIPEIFKLDSFFIIPLLTIFIVLISYSVLGTCIGVFYRKKPLVAFVMIIGLIFPLIAFFIIDKQKIEYTRSEINLANYISQHDYSRPVYLYQDYERISTILFYLHKRLFIIDSHSQDLYYGMHSPRARNWFLSLPNFANKNNEVNYVLVKKDKFLQFLHALPRAQYCIVAQSGGSVLLSNKPEDCN